MRPALPFLVLILVLIAGCEQAKPLPPPGARGRIVLQLWEEPGRPPAVLLTRRMDQLGDRSLAASPVVLRLVMKDGIVDVRAPSARLVDGPEPVTLDGPVRFSGTLRGLPLAGYADRAVMHGKDRSLVMTAVDAVHGTVRTTAPELAFTEGGGVAAPRGVTQTDAPPHLKTWLMALPRPLPLGDGLGDE